MLTVNFYSFSKKSNSTARPSDSPAASFECLLKEPSSILSPRIVIDQSDAWNPADLNYCCIPAFGRYYYCSWTFARGLWEASCRVDVLATYRDQIGGTTLYIMRSSAASDGSIVDSLYPAKTDCSYAAVTGSSPFFINPDGGWYVIGIAAADLPNFGSVAYYAVDPANLLNLAMYLNTDFVSPGNGFDTIDATLSLQRSLIDPFQYITSCIWYPFDSLMDSPPVAGGLTTINIMGIACNAAGYYINSGNPIKSGSITMTMPQHPEASWRGNYLNAAYRKIVAKIPPFGTFEIDPSVAANYSTVYCDYNIDCVSGIAVADIGCGNLGGLDHFLTRIETRVGVPIQLTGVYRDTFGGAASLGGGLMRSVGAAIMGDPFNTVSGITSGITSAVNSMRPVLESVGSTGSFASLYGAPELSVQFIYQVEEDNDHAGRPLCRNRRPADLGGYMLVRDGDVALPGMDTEIEAVKAILESGFYYE